MIFKRLPLHRTGLSLPEVLLGAFFLTIVFFGFFRVNQSANKYAYNALYELHAVQLAQETLEVCTNLGYETLKRCSSSAPPPGFPYSPIDTFVPISGSPQSKTLYYPPESNLFSRKISLTSQSYNDNVGKRKYSAMRVTVTIRSLESGIFAHLLSPHDISFSRLVFRPTL